MRVIGLFCVVYVFYSPRSRDERSYSYSYKALVTCHR